MPNPADAARALTPAEIQAGIVLDFEGIPRSPPSVVGALTLGQYEAIVLDPMLARLATFTDTRTMDPDAFAEELVRRASIEGRLILSYTDHDRDVAGGLLGETRPALKTRLHELHRNVKPLIQRDHNRRNPKATAKDRTLKEFARLAGMPYPEHLLAFDVPERIRHFRDLDARLDRPDDIPPHERDAWATFLAYNHYDCEVTARLAYDAATRLKGA